MALTRPRFGQLNTSIVAESDPITVLHQGATQANVDVGFLFNRANGLISNVALYWSESAQSIVTAFTSNSGATDSNISVSSYANLTVGNLLLVQGSILGVVGNLQIGNLTANTGVYAVSSVVSGDAYVGGNLTVVGNITTLSREIVTGVEVVAGNLVANSGTASSSTTTGAVVVQGGVGISGNLWVGGPMNLPTLNIVQSGTGNQYALTMKGAGAGDQWAFTVGSTAGQNNITSLNTAGSAYAPFTVNGSTFTIGTNGAGATTSLYIANNGNVVIPTTTTSTSTTTGALVVAGGAGIAGDVNIGANLTYGTVPVLESTRTVTSIGTAPVAIDWFSSSVYRSAKYVVSTTDVTNSQYQTVDITLVQNGTTSTISSYGEVTSGASTRMTFTSNVMSGNVILWGTGVSANNTIKLVRTLIPV